MALILDAASALRAGERVVGGKAMGLARLARLTRGRVPPWLVIGADAFRARLAEPDVQAVLTRELPRVAAVDPLAAGSRASFDAAERALRAIVERPLDAPLRDAVTAALAQLGPGPYAVRSSMVGEDGASRSFAGQFDTFLERPDAEAVLHAIVRCWGSAFSARSIAYRRRTNDDVGDTAMAVVVQRMVRGTVSGVVFTANPTTGRRDEVVVTACWGLGEGIVSGACATDEHVVGHDGRERSAKIVEKDTQIVAAEGGGTREAEVPHDRRRARCVPPELLARLVGEALDVAHAEGRPTDLEWTVDARGELHWLQARPITTLHAESRGPRIVWDNSNIQESYCGVTTPLTFSFAIGAYASVYEQTMRLVGLPEKVISDHRPVLTNLLGLVRGRVYYNLQNWYRLLLLLPSFGRNKADMERMMGLESPVDFVEDQVLSAREKAARAPRLALTMGRLVREFSRLDRSVTAFLARFDAAMNDVDRTRVGAMSLSELMTLATRLREELIEHWETPIVNDLYVMQASGRLRRTLESIVGPERAPAMWTALVAGEDGIESTEPTRALLRIAKVARDIPALAELLRSAPPEEAIARARAAHAGFAAHLDRFLDRYGDRCMGELKLESLSLRDDDAFLARVLRGYLERPDLDADTIARRERAAREAAEREVMASLSPLARARLRRALAATRKGIKARENMRLARTRLFGVHRDLYRAVGARLAENGHLDDARDVFYLTTGEIASWCAGTAVSAELAPIARARKAELARYELEAMPNRFETVGPVHDGNVFAPPEVTSRDRRARTLRGTGASAGRVQAKIRVVMDATSELEVNGHVLTTLRTDPGWAPLFPTACAVLVERGSTLSHSAVLARELGIPCVVGVPNLLAVIHDGETVRLDGSTGTVERLDLPIAELAPARAETFA